LVRRAILNIAHRGASGSFPENTLSSFRAAIDVGAEMCELDVALTRDQVAVVIHDDTVDRTTDGQGEVAAMTLAEMKQLDAGAWFDPKFIGERVPTLDEVFEAAKGRCGLNIELKARGAEPQVVHLMRKHAALGASIVSSFEWETLWRARELEPTLRIALLAEKEPERLLGEATRRRAWAINPRFDLVNVALCARAHREGLKVYTWTVDEPEAMRILVAHGVDGIMTNYPDRLRAIAGS
jgi:glycerophosphoryl diester phosphodiesterase